MSSFDYRPEPTLGASDSTSEKKKAARKAVHRPLVVPLTYRLDDLPVALNVSRRTIERERAAGRFPEPDLKIGKSPLWLRETIVQWIAGYNPPQAGKGVAL